MTICLPPLIVLIISLLWPLKVAAYCQEGKPPVESEYKSSEYVLLGNVSDVIKIPATIENGFVDGIEYTINIIESYKGSLPNPFVIYNETASGQFSMEVEKSYILFIYKDGNANLIDSCGNSSPASEAINLLESLRNLRLAQPVDYIKLEPFNPGIPLPKNAINTENSSIINVPNNPSAVKIAP